MYSEDWKKTTYRQENEDLKAFKYSVRNPRTQQVIISIDIIPLRMYPEGCENPKNKYAIYL